MAHMARMITQKLPIPTKSVAMEVCVWALSA